MASLMAMGLSDSGLDLVLSAHLDSLAISPQAKQAVIPAFLGMVRFNYLGSSIAQPQAAIEPPGSSSHSGIMSATSSMGAHASYQMYKRPFSSSSGSGYTTWYFYQSDSSIQSPPMVSHDGTVVIRPIRSSDLAGALAPIIRSIGCIRSSRSRLIVLIMALYIYLDTITVLIDISISGYTVKAILWTVVLTPFRVLVT